MSEIVKKDAIAAWKLLVAADRENMSLQRFTQFINEQYGRNYDSLELKIYFEDLKSGKKDL